MRHTQLDLTANKNVKLIAVPSLPTPFARYNLAVRRHNLAGSLLQAPTQASLCQLSPCVNNGRNGQSRSWTQPRPWAGFQAWSSQFTRGFSLMRRTMAQARSKFPRDDASETAPGDATVSLAPGSAGGHSGATGLRHVDSAAAHRSQPLHATSTNPLATEVLG